VTKISLGSLMLFRIFLEVNCKRVSMSLRFFRVRCSSRFSGVNSVIMNSFAGGSSVVRRDKD
jgi:hypothetical protein